MTTPASSPLIDLAYRLMVEAIRQDLPTVAAQAASYLGR